MAQQEEKISIIVAIARDAQGRNVIGAKGDLLWRIPEDLQHFKEITLGHPIIMGRKTWESLPPKMQPLPGRTNIIVTRDMEYHAEGAILARSFPEAISLARDAEGAQEIFAIGGTQIYEAALPFAQRIYLTKVEAQMEGDAFFPNYEDQFTKVVEKGEIREHGDLRYQWLTLERG